MIVDLKPYPAYKDSGVPWLGRGIPEHWEVHKLRNLLKPVAERNRSDLPLLSVVREKGVIQRDITNKDENRNFIPDDLTNYKAVRVGQFAMNKMKAWQGSYGVSQHEGIVSPAYFVFDLTGVAGEFFNSAIRSRAYVPFFAQASDGVRIGQWDLAQARMKEISFFVPPLTEQSAIVRFLDYADRRIRRYISAKQKLIKLLEEQKQAIIHRAVTRGLNPNVHLKPSGVEWLGDVPEHWEVVRLGRLIKLATGFPFKSDGFSQSQTDVRLLRGINIAPGRVRWETVVHWPTADCHTFADFEMKPGDIVLGMDRPIISGGVRVAIITDEDVPSLLLQRVARIRPLKELNAMFAIFLLSGKSFSDYLAPIFTGISVPHVSPEQIGAFRLALPGNEEQALIVRWVADATAAINTAIERAHREVSLLREYRTRLIADVVTGKLDVRVAAAKLPEETDESEPLDDAEALVEGEEETEDADLDAAPEETEA